MPKGQACDGLWVLLSPGRKETNGPPTESTSEMTFMSFLLSQRCRRHGSELTAASLDSCSGLWSPCCCPVHSYHSCESDTSRYRCDCVSPSPEPLFSGSHTLISGSSPSSLYVISEPPSGLRLLLSPLQPSPDPSLSLPAPHSNHVGRHGGPGCFVRL